MSTFFPILVALASLPLGFVLLSFSFAWYEAVNHSPSLLEKRFHPASLRLAFRLISREYASLLAAIFCHPFGWLPDRVLAKKTRNQIPVLFLHGLFHNRSCWTWMIHQMKKRGLTPLYTINLPPWNDIDTLTNRVAARVDRILDITGAEAIHLVGHSMGGIIAREFIQMQGGAEKVQGCVFLGVPHRGSKLAPFGISPLARKVMPDSGFLNRLEGAPVPGNIRFLGIFSRHDNIVLPPENARWGRVSNLEMEGLGHASLLFHSRTAEAIFLHLKGDTA